jgi:hypothetical protein
MSWAKRARSEAFYKCSRPPWAPPKVVSAAVSVAEPVKSQVDTDVRFLPASSFSVSAFSLSAFLRRRIITAAMRARPRVQEFLRNRLRMVGGGFAVGRLLDLRRSPANAS